MPYVNAKRIIDLSHPIEAGMTTYPGLPGPEITDHMTREESRTHYAPGTEFQIGRITMVGNTGTYVDSPFHRFGDGTDLAGLPLDRLADLPALCLTVRERAVTRTVLERLAGGRDLAGTAVLIHTGWDRHWRTERYHSGHPYLSADAADWLVDRDVALVGIDSVNIDATDGPARPVHTALLAAGIPIVEHLANLGSLPVTGARFHAVPAPVVGFASFPVRAYAVIPDHTS